MCFISEKKSTRREKSTRFTCDTCGLLCASNVNLKAHKRTHTGEKPYGCELCEYRCSLRGSIAIHMKTHTGDKPHICDMCGKKFSQKCSLNRHLYRIHNKRVTRKYLL